MTDESVMPTLVCVPTASWPRDEFLAFIEARWKREGYRHKTEVMRAAGMDPSLHTNWGKGMQPTTESLDKLAPVLKVPATTLYVVAGRLSPGQLEVSSPPETRVLPQEIQDLIDLYTLADTSARRVILQQVSITVRGLSALLAEDPPARRPSRRRPA